MYVFKNKVYNCTLEITSEIIGGRWKPAILWYLQSDTIRFGELKRKIKGVSQKMLTQQLRELEEDGLIIRQVFPEVPPRVEYSLSERGKTLVPMLSEMCRWGRSYMKENHIECVQPTDNSSSTARSAESY